MSVATAVEVFEHIIRHQSVRELVPFLLTLEKKDVVAAREKLKALKKELETVVQLTPNSWGSLATSEQHNCMFLTGFAVFSRREALNSSFNSGWQLSGNNRNNSAEFIEHFLLLIRTLRTDWLGDWLQYTHDRARGWAVNYYLLRKLEAEHLISYLPEVTGRAVVQLLYSLGHELSELVPVPSDAADVIAERIRANSLLIQRDLPLLFEFQTEVAHTFAHIQQLMVIPDAKTIVQEARASVWQEWNRFHPIQNVGWASIIQQLVASGHLDRADILTRCLQALRRDFRRPLLTWFKELFLALQPTVAERLARQAELTELLVHPLPLVANFAIDQLKGLLAEAGFSLASLLLYADNFLTRPDLKTGIRALLAGLLKLPKQNAAHAPAVAKLLATALPHPDSAVQERAAKGLASLLTAPQPLLSPTEAAAAVAVIQQQAELLGPAARAALASWLAPVEEAAVETASYTPAGQFVPELSAATAIVPVADWHELLFLTGQVVQHKDPVATERWLDGLLQLNGQWPAGFAEQLRPYLAQLFPKIKKASEAEIAAILTEPVWVYGHEGLVQALLLTWATDFTVARVESVDLKSPHTIPNPLLAIEKQRYLLAESLLKKRQALPLLSTPTHQPHWVAPSTLVARLLAYQAAGVAPEPADVAVALARTAHAHTTETAEALRQLPALADTELRELVRWSLGPADQALPTLPNASEQRPPARLQAPVAEALPELWAVAARTKAPAGSFPTLPAALGYDHPSVAQPLLSTFEVMQRENRYSDPEQPDQIKIHHFVELAWSSGAQRAAPSPLLLYAPPTGRSQYGSWEENGVMTEDLPFLLALLPNCPAPLYTQVVCNAAWADKLESSERDLLLQALRALLHLGPALGPAETALLASGLVHHTPPCRSLAQEVLLRAIAEGRLRPAELGRTLGRQLAVGYAPVPRLTDSLAALLAIDALTDDALCQVLEALLPELPAEPLRNTRKLLELYASLRSRTQGTTPPEVRARLSAWQAIGSLKMVSALLA